MAIELKRPFLKLISFFREKIYLLKTFLLSRIKNSPLIYVVGDSHSLTFSLHSPYITHHLGAVTAFNILKENSSTGSKEKLFSIANKINKKKDVLMLVFGEIDCRIHVYRQFKKSNETISMESIIDSIIDSYFLAIEKLQKMGINLVIYGVPPANFQGNFYAYDYYAEPEIQAKIKDSFNTKLKNRCNQNGLKYLEIFHEFSDSKGFILKEFSQDELHLNDKILPYTNDWFRKQMNLLI